PADCLELLPDRDHRFPVTRPLRDAGGGGHFRDQVAVLVEQDQWMSLLPSSLNSVICAGTRHTRRLNAVDCVFGVGCGCGSASIAASVAAFGWRLTRFRCGSLSILSPLYAALQPVSFSTR